MTEDNGRAMDRVTSAFCDFHVWPDGFGEAGHVLIIHKLPYEQPILTWLTVQSTCMPGTALAVAEALGRKVNDDPTPKRMYRHRKDGAIDSWPAELPWVLTLTRATCGHAKCATKV